MINLHTEQTLLDNTVTVRHIHTMVEYCVSAKIPRVCVLPGMILDTAAAIRDLSPKKIEIVTVACFPHGSSTSPCFGRTKANEIMELGAMPEVAEIDYVADIYRIKNRDTEWLTQEAESIRAATDKPLKCIIEAGLLSIDEIYYAVGIYGNHVNFIKTSTGTKGPGATPEMILDIRSALRKCGSLAAIKAAGGIKTADQALKLISVGAERIGTSSKLSWE